MYLLVLCWGLGFLAQRDAVANLSAWLRLAGGEGFNWPVIVRVISGDAQP